MKGIGKPENSPKNPPLGHSALGIGGRDEKAGIRYSILKRFPHGFFRGLDDRPRCVRCGCLRHNAGCAAS